MRSFGNVHLIVMHIYPHYSEKTQIFYNRIRKQARLGYLSPAQFTQQYHAKQIAA